MSGGYKIENFQHQPHVIPDATADEDGAMSSEDKTKLDSITPGAIPDFYNQFFSGSFANVLTGLHEIFRFTPDFTGYVNANLTMEFMIFSSGPGDSTQRQTRVYSFRNGSISGLAGEGAAVAIGDGLVNSTVQIDGTDITISMSGESEDPPSVFVVVKCRVSNGEE